MIIHSLNDFLLQFTDVPLIRDLYTEAVRNNLNQQNTMSYMLWELASSMEPEQCCGDCNGKCDAD